MVKTETTFMLLVWTMFLVICLLVGIEIWNSITIGLIIFIVSLMITIIVIILSYTIVYAAFREYFEEQNEEELIK